MEQLQNTEAQSDEYVEKVTHISADITEVGYLWMRISLKTENYKEITTSSRKVFFADNQEK